MARYGLIHPASRYGGTTPYGRFPMLVDVLGHDEDFMCFLCRVLITHNGKVVNQKRAQRWGFSAQNSTLAVKLGLTGHNLIWKDIDCVVMKQDTPIKFAVRELLNTRASVKAVLREAKLHKQVYDETWGLDLPVQYGKILTMKTKRAAAVRKKGKRK